jgi:hypothetical protein
MKLVRDAAARAGIPLLLCGHIPVCEHNLRDVPNAIVELGAAGASAVKLEVDPATLPSSAGRWIDASVESGLVNNIWVSVEGGTFAEIDDRPIHYRSPVDLVEIA